MAKSPIILAGLLTIVVIASLMYGRSLLFSGEDADGPQQATTAMSDGRAEPSPSSSRPSEQLIPVETGEPESANDLNILYVYPDGSPAPAPGSAGQSVEDTWPYQYEGEEHDGDDDDDDEHDDRDDDDHDRSSLLGRLFGERHRDD